MASETPPAGEESISASPAVSASTTLFPASTVSASTLSSPAPSVGVPGLPPPPPPSVLSSLLPLLDLPLVDVAGTERFLSRVLKEDNSEAFHRPVKVTPDIADYSQRIRRPMDLSTVRSRFRGGQYATYRQLFDDVELIWDNCIEYNGEDHYLAVKANALRDKSRLHLLRAIEHWERRDEFTGAAAKRCKDLLNKLCNSEIGTPFTLPLHTTEIWNDYKSK
jgi:Bromodomain